MDEPKDLPREETVGDSQEPKKSWSALRILSLIGALLLGVMGANAVAFYSEQLVTSGNDVSSVASGLILIAATVGWTTLVIVLFFNGRDRLAWKITGTAWIMAFVLITAVG